MATAIHALTIWIMQDHYEMSEDELMAIKDICIFVVYFYTKLWFRAPFVADWAYLEAELHRNLSEYAR